MISILITLIIVGVVLWAVETILPIDPLIKRLIQVVVVVCVLVWLLRFAAVL